MCTVATPVKIDPCLTRVQGSDLRFQGSDLKVKGLDFKFLYKLCLLRNCVKLRSKSKSKGSRV